MLALPLVHIHPESDHRHGEANHVHGGIVHTVFSSDLPCEFPAQRPGQFSLLGQAPHALDHPEIGFLLASAGDRQPAKAITDGFSSEGPKQPSLLASSSNPTLPIALPRLFILLAGLSPRSPPSLSV